MFKDYKSSLSLNQNSYFRPKKLYGLRLLRSAILTILGSKCYTKLTFKNKPHQIDYGPNFTSFSKLVQTLS